MHDFGIKSNYVEQHWFIVALLWHLLWFKVCFDLTILLVGNTWFSLMKHIMHKIFLNTTGCSFLKFFLRTKSVDDTDERRGSKVQSLWQSVLIVNVHYAQSVYSITDISYYRGILRQTIHWSIITLISHTKQMSL